MTYKAVKAAKLWFETGLPIDRLRICYLDGKNVDRHSPYLSITIRDSA